MKKLERYNYENKWLGYVWKQDSGQKVIVVVDDCFKLAVSDNPPNAHGYGLKVIFDKVSLLNDTLGIGFFDLPQSCQKQDIELIVDAIKSWIDELKDRNIKLYLLVDYFHGLQTLESKAHGLEFVNYWQEHRPLPTEKIAHLSIGGADLRNPHKLECFQKTHIHDCKQDYKLLPEEFLNWLDVDEHPLCRLWRYSDRWFSSDSDTVLVKHNFSEVSQFLYDTTDSDNTFLAAEYKRKISAALGVNLPDTWWDNEESANNIHESLKCLCGEFFCGQNYSNAKRHLSVGAAYLIALMAYQKVYNNVNLFTNDAETWVEAKQATSPIFALQDKATARASAIALYDFFICLFTPRNEENSRQNKSGKSQVKSVYFYESGKTLKFQLSWDTRYPSSDRQESLAQTISTIFKQETIAIPKSAENTRSAILRLWRQMAISESGFMGPGVIYMEGDTLIVASRK
ncbi:hypothetical protein F7734_33370 [Scytonema sp. UIC 10036]|uniref:hypothetical protein n=1 Tax=Scytonema sp. UIC 10036 TaxID=2304196 RepID=UPI0012DAE453|nr:hypothetical protein [Scytonema sp. UIC 10036]MUG96967.1 hypothetical protein [Scytonema sp. UIC 10036]